MNFRVLDEVSAISAEAGITEGEIWIDPLGRVSFSKGIPEETHQQFRNVIGSDC